MRIVPIQHTCYQANVSAKDNKRPVLNTNNVTFERYQTPKRAVAAGSFAMALVAMREVLDTKIDDLGLLRYPRPISRGLIYSKAHDEKEVYQAKKNLIKPFVKGDYLNSDDYFLTTFLYNAHDIDVIKEKQVTADYLLASKELMEAYDFRKALSKILFFSTNDKDSQVYKRTIATKIVENKEYKPATTLYQNTGKIVASIDNKANYIIAKHVLNDERLYGNRSIIEELSKNKLRVFAEHENSELVKAKLEVLDKFASIDNLDKGSLYFSIGEIVAYTGLDNKDIILRVLDNPKLYNNSQVVYGLKDLKICKVNSTYIHKIFDAVEDEKLSKNGKSVYKLLKTANNDSQMEIFNFILQEEKYSKNEFIMNSLGSIISNIKDDGDKKLVTELLKNDDVAHNKEIIDNIFYLLEAIHQDKDLEYLATYFIYNLKQTSTINMLFNMINKLGYR